MRTTGSNLFLHRFHFPAGDNTNMTVETERDQRHSVLTTSIRKHLNVVRRPAIKKPETYLHCML
jgi:hypothetical protein